MPNQGFFGRINLTFITTKDIIATCCSVSLRAVLWASANRIHPAPQHYLLGWSIQSSIKTRAMESLSGICGRCSRSNQPPQESSSSCKWTLPDT